MKKMFLGGVIAAALAASPAMADVGGLNTGYLTEDAYAGASIGFGDMGLSDSAIIVSGRYGKGLEDVFPNLGVEVETTLTLANASTDYLGYDYDASYFGLSGFAVYNYAVGERIGVQGLTAFGRIGLGFTSYDYEYIDDTDISLALGVGVKYGLGEITGNDRLSVRAEWTDQGLYDEFKAGVDYAF